MFKVKLRNAFNRRPGLDRHQGPVGGVLDDDPAMLAEDSGDWVEDRSGTAVFVLSDSAPSAPIAGALPLCGCDADFLSQFGPFHGLCRFRC